MSTRHDPLVDGAGARRPAPVIGLRLHAQAGGGHVLVGTIDEALTLPAGSTLTLRKLHDGTLPSPSYALVAQFPVGEFTRRARQQAAADRLDGSALRFDGDDDHQEAP